MRSDGSIFGMAVAAIYDEIFRLTKSVASRCEPSPTLFETTANVMCQAAEEAIRKFREESRRHGRH